jgi:hypothetical protein
MYRWTLAGALLLSAGLLASQPQARTQDRPGPELSSAQLLLEGAWLNTDEAMRLVIDLDGGQSIVVTLQSYDREDPLPVHAPMLDGQGGLRFSVQSDSHDPAYLRAVMVDAETLALWHFNPYRATYDDVLLFQRSDFPAGATTSKERAAIEQERQLVIRARHRAELEANLSGIRTAELAYDAAFDEFVATPVHPRPVADLNGWAVAWPGGTPFDDLGWMPDGDVVGCYQVEITDDGMDFIAHGWADLDDDGKPAHWTASRHQRPTRVSPDGVE